VVRRFQFNVSTVTRWRRLSCLLLACYCLAAAGIARGEPAQAPRFVADIQLDTVEALEGVLIDIEQQYDSLATEEPITLVLHGTEIDSFIQTNYRRYQSIVEHSARLTSQGMVQIEICEVWMDANNVEQSSLQPFVKTVDFGESRIRELEAKNYSYF